MDTLKVYIKSYLFYAIAALGVSLTIRANIGISSFNSMNLSISTVSGIKVGTMTIIFNTLFLVGYMLLTRFKFKFKYLLQGLSVLMFGLFINFYTYHILNHLVISFYFQRVLLVIVGTLTAGTAVGMVLNYDKIAFPMESFCVELSKVIGVQFVFLRYGVDVISAIVSLLMTYMYGLPLFIREGTIINMTLLSWSINFAKEKLTITEYN